MRMTSPHTTRRQPAYLMLVLAFCLTTLPACRVTIPLPGADAPADEAAETAPASLNPLDGITAESRVVALSRSIGEMWLLAGGQLVGATDDALDLAGIAEDTASVGSIANPSLEKVLSLEPDVVLLNNEMSTHKELHAALDGAGIPVYEVNVDSFAQYASVMKALTGATGRSDLYDKNVVQVKAKVDEVIDQSAQQDRGSYLALRISDSSSRLLGSNSFTCAMLEDLGMTSASGGQTLDDPSIEDLAADNPDWIFVIYQGDVAKAQRAYEKTFVSKTGWAELAAVKAGHVVVLPKDLFQYKPNARWAEAYAYLSQVLHGAWA